MVLGGSNHLSALQVFSAAEIIVTSVMELGFAPRKAASSAPWRTATSRLRFAGLALTLPGWPAYALVGKPETILHNGTPYFDAA